MVNYDRYDASSDPTNYRGHPESYAQATKGLILTMLLELVPLGSTINCLRDPESRARTYISALTKDILKSGIVAGTVLGVYKGIEALVS